MALVVSGLALTYIFADDRLQQQFLSLAMASAAVVACRVSPPQKAAIVRMVRVRNCVAMSGDCHRVVVVIVHW
jgi:magnesium-transporting ATPase (P-type)